MVENCGTKTVWFLILVLLALHVAYVCALFYIILHPISVCVPNIEPLLSLLFKGLQLPHYCAERMMGVPLQGERDLQNPHTVVTQQTTLNY